MDDIDEKRWMSYASRQMRPPENAPAFLAFFFGALVLSALILPPFPQDPVYHQFGSDHSFQGIPHFWNVVSNGAFLAVAALGWRLGKGKRSAEEILFLAGVFLTGAGSGFYHWAPSTETLFWDRLPMTIAFSGATASLAAGRVDERLGRRMLAPLAVLSVASVLYWRWSESAGRGNLSPYGVVQFGTMAFTLAVLILFPRQDPSQRRLWLALVFYLLAKILEALDQPIAEALRGMGGHPLKHLAAALGCWHVWRALFDPGLRLRPPSKIAANRTAT